MQKQKPLLLFRRVSQKDWAAWADCVWCRWSVCVGSGCRAWQGWLCLPRRSPGLCHPAGAQLAAKPGIPSSVSAVTHCLVLSFTVGAERRVQSIVTIKPEMNYSSQNKAVLKEWKYYNLQRLSIGIALDEIDSENVWNCYEECLVGSWPV